LAVWFVQTTVGSFGKILDKNQQGFKPKHAKKQEGLMKYKT
jgi:hypothetical protein